MISTKIIPVEDMILPLRGKKVILYTDAARLYEVSTRTLNQAVSRNLNCFPKDTMFKLSSNEIKSLVESCNRFKKLKHSNSIPRVFDGFGFSMVANILKSDLAIKTTIEVIRYIVDPKGHPLNPSNQKMDVIFKTMDTLIRPIEPKKTKIGFKKNEGQNDRKRK
ncbi:MAG: ORF6N domain-containing protein [Candidatus Riflebacteria bacterium]|nr:ORF6N domain-containing protein [Candidatus Riflebacteria bacterium]